jgi:hypothetical protein
MRKPRTILVVCLAVGSLPAVHFIQAQSSAARNLAQLDLRMAVATTTDEGAPEALQFTLTNVGKSTIILPAPSIDCSGENGTIALRSIVRNNSSGRGRGHGCMTGTSDEPPLIERVKTNWLHLRPGDSITLLGDCRHMLDRVDGGATYEFWAVYEPPPLPAAELKQLIDAGYNVPSEKIESSHLTFSEL